MRKIIYNELKLLANQKTFKGCLFIILCLWLVAATISYQQYKNNQLTRSRYQEYHRQLWVNQDPKNPHMAAHYGTFAFKPANRLSIFDNGINSYSGSFIYLEAHRQNDFVFSPAQNSSVFLRMGEFNLSFLFQIVIPLLILTQCIGMFNLEKTTGLFSFIEVNSFSKQKLLLCKSLTLMMITGIVYFGLYMLTIVLTAAFGVEWEKSDWISLSILLIFQLLFSYTLILFFLFIALNAKDIKQATVISLSAFILLFFILPRLAVNIANNLYPLPGNLTFKEQVKKDIDNGINGHGKRDEREHLLIDSVLKANHVDSTHQLPVNIDGLMLLKGEEHSAQVYSKHFFELKKNILKQQQISEIFSFFSPCLVIKNISMSLCKTDIESEFNFREQAENYRYYFVQVLNENMMLKSKQNEFYTYKIHKPDFLTIADFHYKEYDLPTTLKNRWQELLTVFTGLILLFFVFKARS